MESDEEKDFGSGGAEENRMTPESYTLRAVLDLLIAHRILSFRMNVGVMESSYRGKKRFVSFGTRGMADVLACPQIHILPNLILPQFLWLEVKAPTGKQTPQQMDFQKIVQDEGHSYLVIRDVNELASWLKARDL